MRNLVEAGAFDAIDGEDTLYVTSSRGVARPEALGGLRGRHVAALAEPPRRRLLYARLQNLLLASHRSRSHTMRVKIDLFPPLERLAYRLLALPGLRQAAIARLLRRTGLHPELHALMVELRPDVVIAPSGGIDPLVLDAVRSARALEVPSLVIAHNWDNLSSKGAFAVKPDYLGVWGEQSVGHAVRIHGFERDRVVPLGAPSLDPYFRHERGSTRSRFSFPYALFAGCYAPFDELSALEALERVIEEQELGLEVVYRPHPHRRPRARPDPVDESRFRHVVIDPEVRDAYMASFAEYEPGAERANPRFPSLDSYPATFEHAELVVCPLSTMIVEAAIFERPVIVIAYDDGIHPDSPATVIGFDHFEGIDRVEGFEVVREAGDLAPAFARMARGPREPTRSLRAQIGCWLHHDERTYAERLAALTERIGRAR